MSYIIDETFGKLVFNLGWTTDYDIELFGKRFNIELIIDNDDEGEITKSQRDSFNFFKENKKEISRKIERMLIKYSKSYLNEYVQIEHNKSIESSITPTGLIFFADDLTDEEIEFGFLFESKFDPEGGIGIKYSDGDYEISTQDIALI